MTSSHLDLSEIINEQKTSYVSVGHNLFYLGGLQISLLIKPKPNFKV